MTWETWLPLLILCSSLVPGLIIFGLGEERYRLRTSLNMLGATLKLVLTGVLVWRVYQGAIYKVSFSILPGLELVLHADALSVLFVSLSTVLWFVTTLYAVGYLEGSPFRSRFFGFFSLCVSSTIGIALAGNLITFLIFYEMLTLATYPLVVHRGTSAAVRGGRIYLLYTLAGGTVLLMAVAWLMSLVGPLAFVATGSLDAYGATHGTELRIIFFMLIAGLGVKAALVPLHGWLPNAMVAPAPVSALLHAVAVVKAGAFGIVRVVYDLYGIEFARDLGLLSPLLVMASFTIVYGSLRALYQDDLKRRLAFSTVSQVSYIALGVATFGPLASIGGIVHLVHQGLMKITLFFCAGNLAETLGIHKVSEMDGVGRRMPWTMAAFTVGALGMIGVPPVAGFFSKWYLGLGGLLAGEPWVIPVLVASTLLNAAYFLPILYAAWFKPQQGAWPEEHPRGRLETGWMLLLPPLVTAALALLAGLFANTPFSALEWAKLIAAREYLL
ncbi:cation:proton antiporter [Desulfuromonas versatilis]|uniref:Cation:proton antiporter n=1 Tax=Desulfuromonas versatilis TaxID=2802975 RepID=A0ABM9SDE2_9BACT|nr:proton-conducting transporter membrane subunit [Desulfuromonas versatilis]BCR03579.1 cation:proton antiporter [Desulfuromonas versatilis]